MARTYTQVRQLTAQQLGHPWPITGTADTGGSTTVLRDAILKVYPNDRLNGAHILLTSGTPSLTELLITDFTQTNGDCTFVPALGAAPDALTYEIFPYSALDVLRAIQDSILQLYDRGLLSRHFWMQMMGGSPIYNADWSYWTSATAVDGWTLSGAGAAIAQERASGNIALSENALKLTSASAISYVELNAKWRRFLHECQGYTIKLWCPALSSVASTARLNLRANGTNNYSAYHGGGGDWELLSVEVAVSATSTESHPRLYNDSTNSEAVYFGMPFITGGPTTTLYPIPTPIMPDGPNLIRYSTLGTWKENKIASGRSTLSMKQLGRMGTLSDFRFLKHRDEDTTTEVGVIDLSSAAQIIGERRLWVEGDGPLTVPTTTTATTNIEVSYSESLLLATLAAQQLLRRDLPRLPLSQQALTADRIRKLEGQFEQLAKGAGQDRGVAPLPLRW